jgi:hypothetical protein
MIVHIIDTSHFIPNSNAAAARGADMRKRRPGRIRAARIMVTISTAKLAHKIILRNMNWRAHQDLHLISRAAERKAAPAACRAQIDL